MKLSLNSSFKELLSYGFGGIFNAFLGLISVPLFSRLMSTSEYGDWTIYLYYFQIVSSFISVQLGASIPVFFFKQESNKQEYVSRVLSTSLVISLGLALVTAPVLIWSGLDMKLALIIIIQSVFNNIAIAASLYFNQKREAFRTNLFIVAINALSLVMGIGLILIFREQEPDSLRIFGHVAAGAITFLLAAVYLKLFRYGIQTKIGKELKYSSPLIIHILSNILLASYYKQFLDGTYGSDYVGQISILQNISLIAVLPQEIINRFWQPRIYKRLKDAAHKYIKESVNLFLDVVLITFMIIAAVSDLVITILLPASYLIEDYNSIYLLFLFGVYLMANYRLVLAFVQHDEKTFRSSLGTVLAALVCFLVMPVFNTQLGVMGVPIALSAGYLVLLTSNYVLLGKRSKQFVMQGEILGRLLIFALTIFLIILSGYWLIGAGAIMLLTMYRFIVKFKQSKQILNEL